MIAVLLYLNILQQMHMSPLSARVPEMYWAVIVAILIVALSCLLRIYTTTASHLRH